MIIYAAIIAATIGLATRLVWAKSICEGKLYRVPILWVGLATAIAFYFSPKSVIFILGVFLVDIVAWLIKGDEGKEKKFADYLNWMLSKLPIKEGKNEETL